MTEFSVLAATPPHGGHIVDAPLPTRPVEGGEIDQTLADCVAALAIVRAQFAQAHRRVDADHRRFLADCERITRHIEGAA